MQIIITIEKNKDPNVFIVQDGKEAEVKPAGIWLRQRRTDLRLSQKVLAKLAGVDVGTIRDIEKGRRKPQLGTRALIEKTLDHYQKQLTERKNK